MLIISFRNKVANKLYTGQLKTFHRWILAYYFEKAVPTSEDVLPLFADFLQSLLLAEESKLLRYLVASNNA